MIATTQRIGHRSKSENDRPSCVSSTQIHKEIQCVELDVVSTNQIRDRLPCKLFLMILELASKPDGL